MLCILFIYLREREFVHHPFSKVLNFKAFTCKVASPVFDSPGKLMLRVHEKSRDMNKII